VKEWNKDLKAKLEESFKNNLDQINKRKSSITKSPDGKKMSLLDDGVNL